MDVSRLLGSCAVLLAIVCACKKPQTFEDAMRLACEYPERPDVRTRLDSLPGDQRAKTLTKEVLEQIQNPEAMSLFKTVPPTREAGEAAFRSAVKRAGIARCWITDPPR